MLPTEDERQKARQQFSAYKAREGLFGRLEAWNDRDCMPAHQWWERYGRSCPELQRVAVRVLSQVSSACACERNWSSYDFIHSRKCNRLTPARARDLVWVFTNGRLASKMQALTSEEAFVGWDEACFEGPLMRRSMQSSRMQARG